MARLGTRLLILRETPAQEWMRSAVSWTRWRRIGLLTIRPRNLRPEPSPLKRVGGKENFRPMVASIKLVPIDRCAVDVEFGETPKKHLPIAFASLERSQPLHRIVGQALFPHLDER